MEKAKEFEKKANDLKEEGMGLLIDLLQQHGGSYSFKDKGHEYPFINGSDIVSVALKNYIPMLYYYYNDDEEKGENEIVEVFQKGFMLGDKVIRFAMVKVAN